MATNAPVVPVYCSVPVQAFKWNVLHLYSVKSVAIIVWQFTMGKCPYLMHRKCVAETYLININKKCIGVAHPTYPPARVNIIRYNCNKKSQYTLMTVYYFVWMLHEDD